MIKLARAFKALSDSNRRKIMELLSGGELTAGEIAAHFKMTKPSISHHLSILKNADMIHERREKQFIYYSLNALCVEQCWTHFFKKLSRARKKS